MNFWSNAVFIFIFLLLCFLTPPTFLETAHTSNMLILLVYLNPFHFVFPHPDMLSVCDLGPLSPHNSSPSTSETSGIRAGASKSASLQMTRPATHLVSHV